MMLKLLAWISLPCLIFLTCTGVAYAILFRPEHVIAWTFAIAIAGTFPATVCVEVINS